MAWDDDKTVVSSQITGAEWNTMVSVINAKATLTGTETLTNKTLTDPDLNGSDVKDIALATFKPYAVGNSSTAATVNWNNGAIQTITLTGNCTLTFTAPTIDSGNYARLTLISTQGSGPYTITWPGTVKWAGGTAPTITTTNGREDIFTFLFNGTNYAAVPTLNFDL